MSSKVSALTELTYPVQSTDTVYVIRSGTSYKGNFGDLFQGYLKFVPGYEGYLIVPASGNTDGSIVQTNDILIGVGAFFAGRYVMMRALQDIPTLDTHFKLGLDNEEQI